MSKAKALGGVASAIVVACASCTGTEVGNPVAEPVSVSLTARSSSGDVALGPSGGDAGHSAFAIDELWVSLGDGRFVIDENCSSQRDTRIVIDGPFVADLARDPSVLAERLPEGCYCSVRVSLERAAASDAGPDALTGYSVLVRGHRADGTAVVIRSRDKPDFVLRGRSDCFEVDDAQNALFLAFDAAAWLEGVDLDSATPNVSGEIVIEPGSEDARLRTFETNLKRSLALFKDGNADGALAPSEATVPLAETE